MTSLKRGGSNMPFIMSRVNIQISEEKKIELKKQLGKAIETIPYKNENSLMVGIEDSYTLFMAGQSNESLAYIEISVWKNQRHEGYVALTEEISKAFQDILGIPLQNIYMRYIDIPGWALGKNYYE